MSNPANIFEVESILETAIKSVLVNEFNIPAVFTSQDKPQFERDLPRVEVLATRGAGQKRLVPVFNGQVLSGLSDAAIRTIIGFPATGGPPVGQALAFYSQESAWGIAIKFAVITKDDIATHIAYRSQVRNAVAMLWLLVNNYVDPTGLNLMPNHCLAFPPNDNGMSKIMVAPERGLMMTDLLFDGKIAIQKYAWAQLAA